MLHPTAAMGATSPPGLGDLLAGRGSVQAGVYVGVVRGCPLSSGSPCRGDRPCKGCSIVQPELPRRFPSGAADGSRARLA